MHEKNLEVAYLLDYYGGMLTEKQREVVDLYYNEDLSLAEISEHAGITRQGVRDSIKRGEAQRCSKWSKSSASWRASGRWSRRWRTWCRCRRSLSAMLPTTSMSSLWPI